MRPFNGGGEMIREVMKDRNHLCRSARPLRGRNAADHRKRGPGDSAGLLSAFDRKAVAAHEHDLLTYAREQLRQLNWLRVIGDAPRQGRNPVIRSRGDARP